MSANKIYISRSLKVFIAIQFVLLAAFFILPRIFNSEPVAQVPEKAHWEIPTFARNAQNPIPSHPETFGEGKSLFRQKCAGCHGSEGRGDGYSSYAKRLDPPSVVTDSLWNDGEGVVHFKVKEGINSMPAFKKFLSDEQIWLVVNYMRELRSTTSSS